MAILPRAALLGAQDIQRRRQAADEAKARGQGAAARHLAGRLQEGNTLAIVSNDRQL